METRRISDQEEILEDFLRLLIKRWGYGAVLQQLSDLEHSKPKTPHGVVKEKYRQHRLKPRDYVEKISLSGRKKDLLLELATRFENRQFLPTIGHVKDFLERKHVHVNSLRGRSAAIPKIIEILSDLPDESLETILGDDNYSGPSRLGPLSDAIKARGAAIRSAER